MTPAARERRRLRNKVNRLRREWKAVNKAFPSKRTGGVLYGIDLALRAIAADARKRR